MFRPSLLFIVLSTWAITASADDLSANRYRGHVRKVDGKFEIITGLASTYEQPNRDVEDIPVSAFWDEIYNKTGWSILEIQTFSNQSDFDQVYAAGLVEGRLTSGKT